MDRQPTTIWLIGILKDIEHTTAGGRGDTWKLAREGWQVCSCCSTRAQRE
ncbi:MAG: hypothetical protein ACREVV_17675 [Steroidobacteraceae bacterium]